MSIGNRVDTVRVSIPERVDSVMTTDSPAEADEQKPPATVTRAGRTVRYWSYEFKRRLVEETMEPGASVSVIARRNDVNANLVFFWRKLYRQGRLGRSEGEQRFVQVGVVGRRSGLPALTLGAAGLIELELPGGIRLRMDSRIEEAVLARVLRAVKSCA
jgi:transposase